MASNDATGSDPLRLLDPLLGPWVAEGESPVGPYLCRRRFRRILDGRYVQMDTHWEYVSSEFDELTVFGPDETHGLQYWSFSSDGDRSVGHLTSAGGRSDQAVVFESLAPISRFRYSYTPIGASGVIVFVVESRSRTGWIQLLEHHYRAA
ncbi:hypothetical protein SAMN04515671_1072 [Nakamurella panacisegetis]|uniref:THAP4-like heme-binding beta-barrel domain-containing protein n=1 Tax=Nakamurella panacisegetis TaxID=1090615 RepID=A0A1H0JWN9_9ACTN|nr:hypothetical protein [Nakamurella panacisegetis]SDO47989.1 hypothetical protein SAMN04515671_1072 [Nakamurella panacisegetis]